MPSTNGSRSSPPLATSRRRLPARSCANRPSPSDVDGLNPTWRHRALYYGPLLGACRRDPARRVLTYPSHASSLTGVRPWRCSPLRSPTRLATGCARRSQHCSPAAPRRVAGLHLPPLRAHAATTQARGTSQTSPSTTTMTRSAWSRDHHVPGSTWTNSSPSVIRSQSRRRRVTLIV